VSPNCAFEVDDFEQDWSYKHRFDFIHSRELEGSIRDHDRLFQQCFEFLNPGGYLEMQTIETIPRFADGTEEKGQSIIKWTDLLDEASVKFGKRLRSVPTWKEKMEKAGFNVVQEIQQVCYALTKVSASL
jgi:trans-aconitate methyltransferase